MLSWRRVKAERKKASRYPRLALVFDPSIRKNEVYLTFNVISLTGDGRDGLNNSIQHSVANSKINVKFSNENDSAYLIQWASSDETNEGEQRFASFL